MWGTVSDRVGIMKGSSAHQIPIWPWSLLLFALPLRVCLGLLLDALPCALPRNLKVRLGLFLALPLALM